MNFMEARVANRREDMPTIAAMIDRFAAAHRLSRAELHDLHVAMDEILTNIIAYAYEEGRLGEILVRLTYHTSEVLADVEDNGRPFDPTQFPAPDLRRALRERKVGGMGIHFARSLMDDLVYSRAGGKNRLRLRKTLTRTPPGLSE